MDAQSRIIEETLRHQLAAVRSLLDSVRAAVEDDNVNCLPACHQLSLKALKGAMPGMRAIVLVDYRGKLLMSDDDLGDRQLDDRQFVASLAGMHEREKLYLSQPCQNSPGVFNVKASMILPAGPHGHAGAVIAILNPEYFDVVMRSVLYAPDMASAVTEQSGKRILYVPRDDHPAVADTAGAGSFFARHIRSGKPISVMRGIPVGGGDECVIVQRTLGQDSLQLDLPLVVSLSRSTDALQQPWRHLALFYGMAWLGFASVGSLALVLLQRRRRWFSKIEESHEAERQLGAERVELALNGQIWACGIGICRAATARWTRAPAACWATGPMRATWTGAHGSSGCTRTTARQSSMRSNGT
jgi:hypothetical protein